MGSIISSRTESNGKIVYEVELDYEEALQLKGHIKNVYLFSEESADLTTNMASRGNKESTKYFLIPKELRGDLNFSEKKVKCQKIESNAKIIFIYVVDKLNI